MLSKKNWIITLSGDKSIASVKKDIEGAGFGIEQVLKEIGCITGTATDAVAKKIKGLPGVADISAESGEINIGPPGTTPSW